MARMPPPSTTPVARPAPTSGSAATAPAAITAPPMMTGISSGLAMMPAATRRPPPTAAAKPTLTLRFLLLVDFFRLLWSMSVLVSCLRRNSAHSLSTRPSSSRPKPRKSATRWIETCTRASMPPSTSDCTSISQMMPQRSFSSSCTSSSGGCTTTSRSDRYAMSSSRLSSARNSPSGHSTGGEPT